MELAQLLLGKNIIHETPSGTLAGRIVETEVYQGPIDRAAHSFENKRTKRTEIMFHEPGHVYTYQMHTHTLVNVVAGPISTPHAILIRAVEPIYGLEDMWINRGKNKREVELTNGPGKLTKALGITMKYYGHHWSEKPLYISEGTPVKDIESSPRVGVRNSGEQQIIHGVFMKKRIHMFQNLDKVFND